MEQKLASLSKWIRVGAGVGVVGFIVGDTIWRRFSDPRALAQLSRFFAKMNFRADGIMLAAALALIAFLSWRARQFPVHHERMQTYTRALWIFLCVWALYLFSAYLMALRWDTPRNKAYFPDLAAAFLQGKAYIEPTGSASDLTFYDGHWYVAFPPLASLLMLPQVALGGPEAVNSVRFSVAYGALNVALVYLLAEGLRRRGLISLSPSGSLWISALFGFGTVHWYMALSGHVWFVSQIVTVTFSLLSAVILLESGSLTLASIALGVGMLARPNVVFLWPFLMGLYAGIKDIGWINLLCASWRTALASMIPLGAAALALLAYNYVRFDNPLEFGYRAMNVGAYLKADLDAYGQFNLHFLPRNLQTMFLALPHWNAACGFFVPSPMGMSILLTTPALLLLTQARPTSTWSGLAWTSALLLLAPLMLYFNTGSAQFGYRFLMDLIVPLLALLALAMKERVTTPVQLLIWLGILVNYLGVLWFHAGVCQ
ncbi:MAG: hypothetical protein HY867_16135 [Chloroflexi bacterium]|nr:hypothetical protein [Chloroflexota bacterium]